MTTGLKTKDALDLIDETVNAFRQVVQGRPLPEGVNFTMLKLEYDVEKKEVIAEWEFSDKSNLDYKEVTYGYHRRS